MKAKSWFSSTHTLLPSGMAAGPPGPPGACAAAAAASVLRYGSALATTQRRATAAESAWARVARRGGTHLLEHRVAGHRCNILQGAFASSHRLCNEQKPCPLPVVWTLWGPWAQCSAECGGGVHSRTRSCQNGSSCPGCSLVVCFYI